MERGSYKISDKVFSLDTFKDINQLVEKWRHLEKCIKTLSNFLKYLLCLWNANHDWTGSAKKEEKR